MRKFFKGQRPSPAMIVGIIALIASLGGGAYAATSKKKVTYKGLEKEARLKVLPFSKTVSGTNCDPTVNDTFVDCATVNVDGSTGFPRKYYVSFTGTFDGVGGVARGDCRIEVDGNPVAGTTRRFEATTHTGEHGEGYALDTITGPIGGKHAISVACDDAANDLRIHQFQLSAFQVR